jgi:hypothetical protein
MNYPTYDRVSDDVPEGTPHGYTYQDGINHGNQAGYDKGYFVGYETGKQEGIRVNRVPVWRRIAHYATPVAMLVIGLGIGMNVTPTTVSTPTIPPQPTRATQQVAPTTNGVKAQAFTNLLKAAHERGSMSSLSADQLHDVMDNFVCGNNDLMSMGNGYKGISGSDVGYLWGANSALGYC